MIAVDRREKARAYYARCRDNGKARMIRAGRVEALRDIRMACGWCGAHLSGRPEASRVSHGICESCLQRELSKLAQGASA